MPLGTEMKSLSITAPPIEGNCERDETPNPRRQACLELVVSLIEAPSSQLLPTPSNADHHDR